MKVLNKQYILGRTENITVEYIENKIKSDNCIPLRWAIVKSCVCTITIDATVISKES